MHSATFEDFFSVIDGARYTEYDPVYGRLFVWNGGHTINIFENDGKCYNMFVVGDMVNKSAELEEVQEGIKEYRNEAQNSQS